MTMINQPVTPGEGPEGFPTPSLPDINQPATPGEGPEGLPPAPVADGYGMRQSAQFSAVQV